MCKNSTNIFQALFIQTTHMLIFYHILPLPVSSFCLFLSLSSLSFSLTNYLRIKCRYYAPLPLNTSYSLPNKDFSCLTIVQSLKSGNQYWYKTVIYVVVLLWISLIVPMMPFVLEEHSRSSTLPICHSSSVSCFMVLTHLKSAGQWFCRVGLLMVLQNQIQVRKYWWENHRRDMSSCIISGRIYCHLTVLVVMWAIIIWLAWFSPGFSNVV